MIYTKDLRSPQTQTEEFFKMGLEKSQRVADNNGEYIVDVKLKFLF